MQPFCNKQACKRDHLVFSSLTLKLGFTNFIISSIFSSWQRRGTWPTARTTL